MEWCCEHCNRTYKRKHNYEKHVLTCRLLSESGLPEDRILPSQEELYAMLVGVVREQQKLRNELQSLKNVVKIKKKVSYVDWLQSHRKPKIHLSGWATSLPLNLSHFETVIGGSTYMRAMTLVLRDVISQETAPPLASFDKQLSCLYGYMDGNWRTCTDEDLRPLIDRLSNGISKLLDEWEDMNRTRLSKDDFDEQYARNLVKVMGPGLSYQEVCYQFRRVLHDIVRLNLRNVVEYEFMA